jgi:hypothetical protein
VGRKQPAATGALGAAGARGGGGGAAGGKMTVTRSSGSQAPSSSDSKGYGAFQYILPDLTPKLEARESMRDSEPLRSDCLGPSSLGTGSRPWPRARLRNYLEKFGRHRDTGTGLVAVLWGRGRGFKLGTASTVLVRWGASICLCWHVP